MIIHREVLLVLHARWASQVSTELAVFELFGGITTGATTGPILQGLPIILFQRHPAQKYFIVDIKHHLDLLVNSDIHELLRKLG